MEISVLILSCVILGLNPLLPVLHIYFFKSRFVTLYGFYQIKYIHTQVRLSRSDTPSRSDQWQRSTRVSG